MQGVGQQGQQYGGGYGQRGAAMNGMNMNMMQAGGSMHQAMMQGGPPGMQSSAGGPIKGMPMQVMSVNKSACTMFQRVQEIASDLQMNVESVKALDDMRLQRGNLQFRLPDKRVSLNAEYQQHILF